jgi:hypothetical protein
MKFSDRKGFTKAREALQKDGIDDALKNSIWTVINIYIWQKYQAHYSGEGEIRHSNLEGFCQRICCLYYKKPIDTLDINFSTFYGKVREYYFTTEWFHIYNFIAFTIECFPFGTKDEYVKTLNVVFENEKAAYRIINGEVVDIIDDEEIKSIEDASAIKIPSIQEHLQKALHLYADNKKPDYRNSIKESISAVGKRPVTPILT